MNNKTKHDIADVIGFVFLASISLIVAVSALTGAALIIKFLFQDIVL
jgi:hypothetical protein